MSKSLTYYLILMILKIKGIKRDFSKSPIDYKKNRKEDIHIPKGEFFQNHILNKFNVLESEITEIGKKEHSSKLLIYIPGGAFISGPAQHHWSTIKTIVKKTDYKVWMCDYPKAPEYDIKIISESIDAIYEKALEKFDLSNVIVMGDSVGGTLVTTLVQRLLKRKQHQVPKKIILISPVMDSSMSNPEIEKLDRIDPMLSKNGVLSAKRMCAGNLNLKNKMISPLYGCFDQFPTTFIFIAQNDIMYPDTKLVIEKLKTANVRVKVFEGEGMPHIWPLLPVMKEAKKSLNNIINAINN